MIIAYKIKIIEAFSCFKTQTVENLNTKQTKLTLDF